MKFVNIIVLVIGILLINGCNDASDLGDQIIDDQNGNRNLDPMWVTIDSSNEGQTAHAICTGLGYSEAAIGLTCSGTEVDIIDPNYSHPNCIEGAQNYSQCFIFYTCSNVNPDGVVWDSIYCQ